MMAADHPKTVRKDGSLIFLPDVHPDSSGSKSSSMARILACSARHKLTPNPISPIPSPLLRGPVGSSIGLDLEHGFGRR